MVLLEMKLKKILGSKTAALDDATERLKMAYVHTEHVAERLKANDLKGAEKAIRIEALLVAEANLDIGLFSSVYGTPDIARKHLLIARDGFLEQKDHDIAAQITRYMSTLGL